MANTRKNKPDTREPIDDASGESKRKGAQPSPNREESMTNKDGSQDPGSSGTTSLTDEDPNSESASRPGVRGS